MHPEPVELQAQYESPVHNSSRVTRSSLATASYTLESADDKGLPLLSEGGKLISTGSTRPLPSSRYVFIPKSSFEPIEESDTHLLTIGSLDTSSQKKLVGKMILFVLFDACTFLLAQSMFNAIDKVYYPNVRRPTFLAIYDHLWLILSLTFIRLVMSICVLIWDCGCCYLFSNDTSDPLVQEVLRKQTYGSYDTKLTPCSCRFHRSNCYICAEAMRYHREVFCYFFGLSVWNTLKTISYLCLLCVIPSVPSVALAFLMYSLFSTISFTPIKCPKLISRSKTLESFNWRDNPSFKRTSCCHISKRPIYWRNGGGALVSLFAVITLCVDAYLSNSTTEFGWISLLFIIGVVSAFEMHAERNLLVSMRSNRLNFTPDYVLFVQSCFSFFTLVPIIVCTTFFTKSHVADSFIYFRNVYHKFPFVYVFGIIGFGFCIMLRDHLEYEIVLRVNIVWRRMVMFATPFVMWIVILAVYFGNKLRGGKENVFLDHEQANGAGIVRAVGLLLGYGGVFLAASGAHFYSLACRLQEEESNNNVIHYYDDVAYVESSASF